MSTTPTNDGFDDMRQLEQEVDAWLFHDILTDRLPKPFDKELKTIGCFVRNQVVFHPSLSPSDVQRLGLKIEVGEWIKKKLAGWFCTKCGATGSCHNRDEGQQQHDGLGNCRYTVGVTGDFA